MNFVFPSMLTIKSINLFNQIKKRVSLTAKCSSQVNYLQETLLKNKQDTPVEMIIRSTQTNNLIIKVGKKYYS